MSFTSPSASAIRAPKDRPVGYEMQVWPSPDPTQSGDTPVKVCTEGGALYAEAIVRNRKVTWVKAPEPITLTRWKDTVAACAAEARAKFPHGATVLIAIVMDVPRTGGLKH